MGGAFRVQSIQFNRYKGVGGHESQILGQDDDLLGGYSDHLHIPCPLGMRRLGGRHEVSTIGDYLDRLFDEAQSLRRRRARRTNRDGFL